MIDAIQTSIGIALTWREQQARRERRPVPRRPLRRDVDERIEIADALEAAGLDTPDAEAAPVTGGATVTAAAVAARLAAGAERAVAIQARLGSTIVRHLLGADG